MKKKSFIVGLFIVLVILTACSSSPNVGNQPGEDQPQEEVSNPAVEEAAPTDLAIVLADISDEPAKKIKRFQPLADYLAAHLTEYGYTVGEVKIAPDRETMATWLAAGEVDLYFDSLFPAMIVADLSGGEPILRRWKDGTEQYHTVFFALANSGTTSVEDLVGKMVALEEPNSTSGFMLPLSYLLEAGLNPVEKDAVDSAVGEGEVGYAFSYDDQNTLQWVVSGVVAAGATDDGNFAELQEDSDADLIIVAETESVPRQVAIVRPGMDPEVLQAIITLLVELDESPEGQAVLEEFKTSQFDEFPGGTENAFVRMRELYSLVTGE